MYSTYLLIATVIIAAAIFAILDTWEQTSPKDSKKWTDTL